MVNDDKDRDKDEEKESELEKKKPTPPSTVGRIREVFNIGTDQYAFDIFPGAAPALSPGDTLIISKSLAGGGTLQIIKKASGTPIPTPTPTPIPLTATDFSVTGTQNKPLTIDFSGHINDSNTGATITSITIITQPKSGTISNVSGTTVTYTPNSNFAGTDTFTWKANDSRGAISDVAQATINIQASGGGGGGTTLDVSDASYTTAENTPLQIVLSVVGGQGPYTWNESNPINGTLVGTQLPVAANETALTYTPNSGSSGTDSFTYSAKDSKGNVSNTATVTITISAPTPVPSGGNVDMYGVKKLYADGSGPVTYMDMTDPTKTRGASPGNNPEGNSQYYPKFQKNSDGSWKNTNGKEVRWAWCAEGDYPGDSNICKCYDTDNKNGYMSGPGDWPPRVEMTGYYRSNPGSTTSNTSNGETHIEHVISGHRSTTSNTPSGPGNCDLGCAGSYHCNKYPLTGRQKFEKDYKHSASYAKDISGTNNTSATPKWANDGQWHGFKDIFYILPNGMVQLESWTDWNADQNWKKTHSFQDDGQKWVPKTAFSGCGGGSQTIAFLFNGPLVDFRADNWSNYDLKWLSIRSIDPTKPLADRREHDRKLSVDDFVEENDVIYQEQKWHEDDDKDIAKAKSDAEKIAALAKDPVIKKDAAEVAKKASK